MDSTRPDRDALESELGELRARLKTQGDELAALRAQLAPSTPTRRDLLRAGGLVGAGLAALTVAGIAGAAPQPADAIEGHNVRLAGPLSIFLTLKGQKSGNIQGGVTQKGREGSIQVQYLQQKKVSPRDLASGLPTGKVQHEPLVFRKQLDKSTPVLQNAMSNNESLTEVHFKFYKATLQGAETNHFTIDLINASIASYDLYHPDTMDIGGGGKAPDSLEELTLTYQKIIWTWNDGGISAEDDWSAR